MPKQDVKTIHARKLFNILYTLLYAPNEPSDIRNTAQQTCRITQPLAFGPKRSAQPFFATAFAGLALFDFVVPATRLLVFDLNVSITKQNVFASEAAMCRSRNA